MEDIFRSFNVETKKSTTNDEFESIENSNDIEG